MHMEDNNFSVDFVTGEAGGIPLISHFLKVLLARWAIVSFLLRERTLSCKNIFFSLKFLGLNMFISRYIVQELTTIFKNLS